jgi:hypothetical protein
MKMPDYYLNIVLTENCFRGIADYTESTGSASGNSALFYITVLYYNYHFPEPFRFVKFKPEY